MQEKNIHNLQLGFMELKNNHKGAQEIIAVDAV